MRHNAQRAESNWKAIDDQKQDLYAHHAIDEAVQKLLCQYGMLFHELREVVQAGSCVACQLCKPKTMCMAAKYLSQASGRQSPI